MKKLVLLIICIFSLAPIATAQNWWQTNSLKLDEMPENLLFHASGQYSLDAGSGTISGFLHDLQLSANFRKKRTMLSLGSDLKYQKVSFGSQVIREKYYLLEGALIYDILRYMHAEIGAIWEKDDSQGIDQRLVSYAGLSNELFSTPSFGFNVMVAMGEQRKLYNNSSSVNVDLIGYVQQNARLRVHPKIFLTQKFIYVQELGDGGSYRNMLRLQAIFRFTPHFSAMVKHETKYEERSLFPWVEKFNHEQTVGFRFEL